MTLPTIYNPVPTESELKSYQIMANVAATNPYWKKLGGNGKPEEVVSTILSVMLLARELGFSPMQAISGGINNIQGKFEISARLMNQAIRSRGHKMQVKFLTDDICTIWGQRKDTLEEMESTYTIEEARRSGLVKDGGAWKKNPQDMLFARAISRLTRRLYPDCIGGCYVEGELQETIQGRIVESIDVPKEMLPKEEPVELVIPPGISEERVNYFITETANQTKKSMDDIRKRAAANFDAFIVTFKKWEEKNFPEVINEEVTVQEQEQLYA